MTFDTAFERSHAPNTMNAEKDKWTAHGIAYKYLDDTDSSRRLQSDIESALATAWKEAFNDAIGVARSVILPPSLREARTQIVAALERAATTDTDNIRQMKEQKIK